MGLEHRVDRLEHCMRHVHDTLDHIVSIYRRHGEYVEADECEVCEGLLHELEDEE